MAARHLVTVTKRVFPAVVVDPHTKMWLFATGRRGSRMPRFSQSRRDRVKVAEYWDGMDHVEWATIDGELLVPGDYEVIAGGA